MTEPDHGLVIPEGGFWPAPEVPQPNIYPMEWRVETDKLAAIYEKSKRATWNPADLPWDGLRAEDFTPEQRLGIMYWFSVLANFDASGPAAGLAAGHAAGAGCAQQHRLAVPQRRPVLDRLQQGGRQVLAARAVHQLHDGRDGRVHAVPRHGVGDHAPGVLGDVPADRPGRVAPPADLHDDPGERVAGPDRGRQGPDHPATA